MKVARSRHEEQTKADRARRITETFSKAAEQLASDKMEARLGGIYTLERLSNESPDDYWTVMETLTAFVRERARWKAPEMIAMETVARYYSSASQTSENPEPPTDIATVPVGPKVDVPKPIGNERRKRDGGLTYVKLT